MSNSDINVLNNQLFKEIFEKLHVALYIVDAEGTLCYVNRAAIKLDHLSRERDVGKPLSDVWNANSLVLLDSPTLDSLNNGVIHEYDNLEWTLNDGTPINAITSSYPIMRDGKIVGAYALAEDISGLKKHLIKQGAFKRKQYYRIHRELFENGTEYDIEDIKGSSDIIIETKNLARKFAEKDITVLIFGETGTGKEMFSQGIHNSSKRMKHPFVAVNCAAIPDTLLENMLFGSVKGAFTGALDTAGLFEKAGDGTLFLDEINSMPIALQAKLLRVLQQKEYRRLGDNKTLKVECRVISAMNKTPKEAISNGELREDLYYRLARGIIELPTLKERIEDLPELVDHFISRLNFEMDATISGISDTLMELFKAYEWPGNVRELSNIVANTVVMTGENDTVLDVEHVPAFMIQMISDHFIIDDLKNTSGPKQMWKHIHALPTAGTLDEMVDAYEEMLIRSAMEASNGKITKAAEILQITRQSLYVKLKKYGIDKKTM